MVRIFFSVLLLTPMVLFAHGSGASYEVLVGEYIVDIGYEPEALQAGERVVFDFNLLGGDRASEPFDSVWVRIEYEGEVLLATGVAQPEYGATSLLYVVPAEVQGDITVAVRYEREGTTLAETNFPLPVKTQPRAQHALQYVLLLCAALVGLGAGYFLKSKTHVL